MKRLRSALAGLALVVWAQGAHAGSTDVTPTGMSVNTPILCITPPLVLQPTCFEVDVRNNGPDPYTGTDNNKLQVTVDIDEPSGPDGLKALPLVFTVTDSFAVNIPVGGTVQVQFNPSGWFPAHAGPFTARATVVARGINVDPNSSNNQLTSGFTVFSGAIIPAFETWGRIALIVGVGLVAWWLWGRRRRLSRN